MGVAHEQRASALYRREADAATAEANRRLDLRLKGDSLCWQDQRAALQARVAELEQQLARAMRSVRELRAQQTLDRTRWREDVERLRERAISYFRLADVMERRWRWVSRLVRAFVRPDQVHQFREEERRREDLAADWRASHGEPGEGGEAA